MLNAGSGVLCSTCATTFESTFHRREHMRSAWHVFNVKRKADSMPPVPLSFHQAEVEQLPSRSEQAASATGATSQRSPEELDGSETQFNAVPSTRSGHRSSVDEHRSESASAEPSASLSTSDSGDDAVACLFCPGTYVDMQASLSHMQIAHGFVVPRSDELATDIETFISYLALVIDTYHACLFCGHEKHCAEAVRSHMLAKGHCQLDLSEQSDFLDFWVADESGDNVAGESSANIIPSVYEDFRLSSGLIISRRRLCPFPKRKYIPERSATSLVLSPASSHRLSNSCSDLTSSYSHKNKHITRALARRDASGVVGLQKRSLAVTQRRAKTTEDRANNKARWTLENMGNKVKQKHFKPDTPGRKNG